MQTKLKSSFKPKNQTILKNSNFLNDSDIKISKIKPLFGNYSSQNNDFYYTKKEIINNNKKNSILNNKNLRNNQNYILSNKKIKFIGKSLDVISNYKFTNLKKNKLYIFDKNDINFIDVLQIENKYGIEFAIFLFWLLLSIIIYNLDIGKLFATFIIFILIPIFFYIIYYIYINYFKLYKKKNIYSLGILNYEEIKFINDKDLIYYFI